MTSVGRRGSRLASALHLRLIVATHAHFRASITSLTVQVDPTRYCHGHSPLNLSLSLMWRRACAQLKCLAASGETSGWHCGSVVEFLNLFSNSGSTHEAILFIVLLKRGLIIALFKRFIAFHSVTIRLGFVAGRKSRLAAICFDSGVCRTDWRC